MSERKPAKWTIIMFISAESNLFPEMIGVMEQLYSVRLKELAKGEVDEKVHFVVLFDGLQTNRFSRSFAIPSIYTIRSGSSFMLDQPVWPEHPKRSLENLTDQKNLDTIFQFILRDYEAEQYGFIYKGHGGTLGTDVRDVKKLIERIVTIDKATLDTGDEEKIKEAVRKKMPLKGWNFDAFYTIEGFVKREGDSDGSVMCLFSRNGRGKLLTYKTIANLLLRHIPKEKLGFVFLDCCWGQLIESAYTFSKCTDFFIASADEMPAAGIGYDDFYLKLLQRPKISKDEIANLLVSLYYKNKYNDYDDGTEKPELNPFFVMGVSLTNIQTKHFDSFIPAFTSFCHLLRDNFEQVFPVVRDARLMCNDYTYVNDDANEYAMYNIDLLWFLDNLLFYLNKKDRETRIATKLVNQLNLAIKEVQMILVKRLRKGFLSSNYKDLDPGNEGLGGQGITITFPENTEQLENSIMNEKNNIRPEFYRETGWLKFVTLYTRKVTSLEPPETPPQERALPEPPSIAAPLEAMPSPEIPIMDALSAETPMGTPKVIARAANARNTNGNGKRERRRLNTKEDPKRCKWGEVRRFRNEKQQDQNVPDGPSGAGIILAT